MAKLYEGSTGLFSAKETSDGGFIAAGYYECISLWIVILICLS